MSTPVVGSPLADVIVVAAGSSTRMGGTDKLAAMVGDRPLLAHTLRAMAEAPDVASLVVVTSADRRRSLEDGGWVPTGRTTFVEGGDRRCDSVRAGFEALELAIPDRDGERIVLIHDGARPMVSAALVASVIEATARHGAAIPVIPLTETIKHVVDDRVETTVDRSSLAAAQTPQGIRRVILREALACAVAGDEVWTDEAALLEACRVPVHVVPGDPANLKVTVPGDLVRAAAALSGTTRSTRTGIGQDAHPFGPRSLLRLGGVEIPGAPGLHGHSDGDVALHAVADALLGAAGLGDLGRLFPAGPGTPRGVDSRELLATVVARLAEAGWRPATLDLTIVGARPRLADHLDAMRSVIATSLGVEREEISVKASSGNLDGAEGAGRSISTLALATIEARS